MWGAFSVFGGLDVVGRIAAAATGKASKAVSSPRHCECILGVRGKFRALEIIVNGP